MFLLYLSYILATIPFIYNFMFDYTSFFVGKNTITKTKNKQNPRFKKDIVSNIKSIILTSKRKLYL